MVSDNQWLTLYTSSIRIIAVTETWLTNQITDKEILPVGFMIFRKDRDPRGGGVLLAIHQSIPAKVLPSPPHLEVITVKLSLPIPLVICAVYLPPNPSYADCSDLCIYRSALFDDNKVITLSEHLIQCDTLEEDEDNRDENSKEFGVNNRSTLLELQHFDLCSGALVPDIMHDLFEGVLQYEIKLVLQHCINQCKYFTLYSN